VNHFEELVKICDDDIRSGQAQNVGRRLAKLNTSRVPREWRLPLAKICRRARLLSLGLKLLARVIFPTRHIEAHEVTGAELAEYAVLLLRAGAVGEALKTLERVDVAAVPEAHLFRAFCHFESAEYSAAIPGLEAYLKTPLEPYALLVGQINLGAAYSSSSRYVEALAILETAIATATEKGHRLLLGNCYELRTQIYVESGAIDQAAKEIDLAMSLMGSASSESAFYARRWKSTVESFSTHDPAALLGFRREAVSKRNWSAVRAADFYLLKIRYEQERFNHLIFGTPFRAYRQSAYEYLGQMPQSDLYTYGNSGSVCLDLTTGEIGGESALNAGKKCHQLIDVLARDFYAPWRLCGIFSELFPDEHFDIFSSPDRVHQLIRRTRRWLEERSLALEILESDGLYRLNFTGAFSIRVPLERRAVAGPSVQLERLRQVFVSGTGFSAREACEKLGLPKSSFQLLAKWAVEQGKLERLGTRNFTEYRFPKPEIFSLAG
jgi:tetratricopeptide (TPR) repeat protein